MLADLEGLLSVLKEIFYRLWKDKLKVVSQLLNDIG